MHSVHKCNCSVRALELFVRDFAGLEVRSRSTRPFLFRQARAAGAGARAFGTSSALRMQRSSVFNAPPSTARPASTTQSLEDALGSVSAPATTIGSQAGAVQYTSASSSGLDILDPSGGRVDARKERKARRAEEAKAALVVEKKKARRERQRKAAEAQSSLSSTDSAEQPSRASSTSSPSSAIASTVPGTPETAPSGAFQPIDTEEATVPGKNRRKKERRRLAEAAEAPTSSPTTDSADGPHETQGTAAANQRTTRSERRRRTPEVQPRQPPAPSSMARSARTASNPSKQASETSRKTTSSVTRPALQAEEGQMTKVEREAWMIQKAALDAKFGEQSWNPRKRISPDALAGIRTLRAQQPTVYTTEVLANHFKVSPEAIRRILKSKWQPSEDAAEDRRKRWEKRGKKKWDEMVELGIRPPKKWRDMGVGKVGPGETPAWKKGGQKGGERWIEHPETDSFVMAGDMASEAAEPNIGDRII